MKATSTGLLTSVLVDSGPLIALLNANERLHPWVLQHLALIARTGVR